MIDTLDELGEKPTDERFSEIYLEICYWLVFREMLTLRYLPDWEEQWKKNLETDTQTRKVWKGGTYGD